MAGATSKGHELSSGIQAWLRQLKKTLGITPFPATGMAEATGRGQEAETWAQIEIQGIVGGTDYNVRQSFGVSLHKMTGTQMG